MFLVSFGVAAISLLVLLIGLRGGVVWTWRVAAVASVADILLGVALQGDRTTRGLVWAAVGALWLVTVPVLIGARALARWKVALPRSPALVYTGAVFVGVGTGWVLLPIVLALIIGVFTAVRG
jgi:hypothetical protein